MVVGKKERFKDWIIIDDYPVSSLNSLIAADLGSSPSSIPPLQTYIHEYICSSSMVDNNICYITNLEQIALRKCYL